MVTPKKPHFYAFTVKSKGRLSEVITPIEVSVPTPDPIHQGQFIKTMALWDTGATNTGISEVLAKKLNLLPVNFVNVIHAGGKERVPYYVVDILLPNDVLIAGTGASQFISGADGVDVIIGMDIITAGDFSITNVNDKTTMSFRLPSMQTIDYVEQVNALQKRELKNTGRNELCPCGSGIKYKQCHGKKLIS